MPRRFQVVTHRNWVARFFAPVSGRQDFGMDIDPDEVANTVWWAPGHWVARAAASGVELPVLSAGADWLANLTRTAAGRAALGNRHVAVSEAAGVPGLMDSLGWERAHVKLPEVKDDRYPALVRDTGDVVSDLASGKLGPNTLVQISEVVNLGDEARMFVARGEVTAASWYRRDGVWHDEPEWDSGVLPDESLVGGVESLLAPLSAPPGFVVDVSVNGDGAPVILEANASWSSNPYDCDPTGVFESIVASHDFDRAQRRWAFDTAQYGRVAPLRLSR